jgi:YidC/Oxa1 family membrane protein insertase
MDRKSIVILAICLGLLLLWPTIVARLYPPVPPAPHSDPGTSGPASHLTAPSTSAPVAELQAALTSAPPILNALTSAPASALPPGEEETLVVELPEVRYTFTSRGGGLKRVELLKYPETPGRRSRVNGRTNEVAELNGTASIPMLALQGHPGWIEDGQFRLAQTGSVVRAEKTLANGVRVVKEFEPGSNYLLKVRLRLENLRSEPVALPPQEWVVGTSAPMGADDDGSRVGLMWFDGSDTHEVLEPWFQNRGFWSCLGLTRPQPRSEYRGGESNVVWVAAQNQFFAMVLMPDQPAVRVVGRHVQLPVFEAVDGPVRARPPPHGCQTAVVYPEETLAAGAVRERQWHLYAGPKEYRTLARIANRFQNEVDLIMGYGGFFGFFSKMLLLSMNWLHHALGLSYGWAIIAITVIIKILFWPLTQASMRSMKRMAALQPQMRALQEKYKDDPAKLNKKMMEFWREHKINPMSGCLPLLLQMPVFIGFFYMIQSAIELRGARFLWVADLSKPDTLFYVFGFPINPLPLLMGATMLWQSHLTPPSPGMDPVQQKLMRWMPLLFLVFLYHFSAGLTLYWTVQNLLSILQIKLTRAMEPAPAPAPSTPTGLPPKKRK